MTDIVIIGGGAAGLMAAVAAAENGARVQLMEPNEAVGGGAAEKGGWEHCAWGAAFCAPRSGRLHTGNPGLRADKGRQGSASG